jgi:hypothetical protein
MTPEDLAMWTVQWVRYYATYDNDNVTWSLDEFHMKTLFVDLTEKAREFRSAVFDEAIEIISKPGRKKRHATP